jgi:hypothetical protein
MLLEISWTIAFFPLARPREGPGLPPPGFSFRTASFCVAREAQAGPARDALPHTPPGPPTSTKAGAFDPEVPSLADAALEPLQTKRAHELRQHDQAENPRILFGSEPVGANHDPGIEFAPDSPLEGTRFEPSVPRRARCFKDRLMSPLPDLPRQESQLVQREGCPPKSGSL